MIRELVFALMSFINTNDKIDPYWILEDKSLADTVYCICVTESNFDTTHPTIKYTKNLAGISTFAKTEYSIGKVRLYDMDFHVFSRYDQSIKLAGQLARSLPLTTYWGCYSNCDKYYTKFKSCIKSRENIDPVMDYINTRYEGTRLSIGRFITKAIGDIRGFISRISI